MTGHPDVDAIGQLNITGNVTPQSWYQHIRYSNKRGNYPDMLAIAILSDIIYWYRPVEVRDEMTLHTVGWRKKFKDDKLQRSPETFAKLFGVSVKQARTSLKLLEDLGIIEIELRSIKTAYGTIPTAMFIAINTAAIARMTYELRLETLENSLLPNSATRVTQFGNKGFLNGQQGLPNSATRGAELGNNTIYRDYSENTQTQDNQFSSVCGEKNEKKEKSVSQTQKRKPRSQKSSDQSPDLFLLWKEQIDLLTWHSFVEWKAAQAPSKVRDRLGWAYNTLRADLERAQLSFESFQQESQLSTDSNTKPDFTTWNQSQHLELAQQYLAKGMTFLKENSWHQEWVTFINQNLPTFFDEIQEEGQ